jgi:hypothetical protein
MKTYKLACGCIVALMVEKVIALCPKCQEEFNVRHADDVARHTAAREALTA